MSRNKTLDCSLFFHFNSFSRIVNWTEVKRVTIVIEKCIILDVLNKAFKWNSAYTVWDAMCIGENILECFYYDVF